MEKQITTLLNKVDTKDKKIELQDQQIKELQEKVLNFQAQLLIETNDKEKALAKYEVLQQQQQTNPPTNRTSHYKNKLKILKTKYEQVNSQYQDERIEKVKLQAKLELLEKKD